MQNMSTFESELENLLGEFHIKMKGQMRKVCPSDTFTFADIHS